MEWRETELNSSPTILPFTSNWGIRFYVGSSQFQEFNSGFSRIWIPSVEVVIEFWVESSIMNQSFLPKIPTQLLPSSITPLCICFSHSSNHSHLRNLKRAVALNDEHLRFGTTIDRSLKRWHNDEPDLEQ